MQSFEKKFELIDRSLRAARYWFGEMCRAGTPDRESAENGIYKLYKAAGANPPNVIWFNNPMSAVHAAEIFAWMTFPDDTCPIRFTRYLRENSKVEAYLLECERQLSKIEAPFHDFDLVWQWGRSYSHGCRDLFSHIIEALVPDPAEASDINVAEVQEKINKLSMVLDLPCPGFVPEYKGKYDLSKLLCLRERFQIAGQRAFCQEIGLLEHADDGLVEILQSCLGFIAFDDAFFVVEKPSVVRYEQERIHCDSGPAIEYADGWGVYVWRSAEVPRRFVMNRDELTIADVHAAGWRAEVKLAFMESYGLERYIRDAKLKPSHTDAFGELFVPENKTGFEILKFPSRKLDDGSFDYDFVCVPPSFRQPKEALAWYRGSLAQHVSLARYPMPPLIGANERNTYHFFRDSKTTNEEALSEVVLSNCQRLSDHWLSQMTAFGPTDRDLVAINLQLLYQAAGASPPKLVHWFSNPKEACRFSNALITSYLSKKSFESVQGPAAEPRCLSKVESYIGKIGRAINCIPQPVGYRSLWEWRNPRGDFFELLRASAVFRDFEHPPAPSFREMIQFRWIWDLDSEPDDFVIVQKLLDTNRLRIAGYRAFLQESGLLPEVNDGLEAVLQSCAGFIAFDDVAVVLMRPIGISVNANGLVHNADDYAVKFADDTGLYCCDQTLIPRFAIMQPHLVTVDLISGVSDEERKWSLIQIYGVERFLRNAGIRPRQRDRYGKLYQINVRRPSGWPARSIALVKVTNSTPEKDGSFNSYFLRTDPLIRTAHEAVAHSFGLLQREYEPTVET